MKKNLLFLFAASALFAACSSDELPNGNTPENGDTPENTVTTNAISVTTPEGLGMSIGVFGEDAETRADDGSTGTVTFAIVPDLTILDAYFEGYEIKADDFYIRKNKKYLDVKPITNGSQYPGNESVKVVIPSQNADTYADPLTVRVQGLEELEYNPTYNDDYTFEAYLWIDRTSPKLNEGSGTSADLFNAEQKLQWVSYKGDNVLQSGVDITKYQNTKPYLYEKIGTQQTKNPDGYLIRYNVYRGISGYQDGLFDEDGNYIGYKLDEDGNYIGDGSELGDTPYIKVSIHVNRLQDDQTSSVTAVYPTED